MKSWQARSSPSSSRPGPSSRASRAPEPHRLLRFSSRSSSGPSAHRFWRRPAPRAALALSALSDRAWARAIDRVFDGLLAAFALQTLLCQIGVVLGGDFYELAQLSLVTAASFVAVVSIRALLRARSGGFRSLRTTPRWLLWLTLLGLAWVALTACIYRPALEDAYPLHLATSTLRSPSAALLGHDALHGLPDVPISDLAVLRQSYELTAAVLAHGLGLDALDVMHRLLPIALAFLVPFAQAGLLRRLFGRGGVRGAFIWSGASWTVSLAGPAVLDHGFTRLHTGEALLVTLVWPLLATAGFELAREHRMRDATRLAFALIASVGLHAGGLERSAAVAFGAFALGVVWSRIPPRGRAPGLIAGVAIACTAVAAAPRPTDEAGPPMDWQLGLAADRVPRSDFAVARATAFTGRRGDRALVPRRVAPWLVTFPTAPTPLVVDPERLRVLEGRIGAHDLARRLTLFEMVSGEIRPSDGGVLLAEAIRREQLRSVVLGGPATDWPELRGALSDAGFEQAIFDSRYHIWSRPRH